MATLSLIKSLLSPSLGRATPVVYSGPAELFSSGVYTDGALTADTLEITDSLGGVLAITDAFTDTNTISDTLSGDYVLQTTDTLTPTATLETPDQSAAAFIETLTFAETFVVPDVGALLTDTPFISDTLSGFLQTTASLADTLAPTDVLSVGLITLFSETLTPTDTLAAGQEPAPFVETLTLADGLTGFAAISATLTDTVSITDDLGAIEITTFTETLTPATTLTGMAALESTFTETLTPTDDLTSLVALYGTLTETLTVSDSLSGALTLLGVFTDTVTAGDTLLSDPSQRVFAINAETGAVSEYRFTPTVQGVGAWGGQLYLATDTGLYALDATTDDGAAIEWDFLTGFSNLGTDRLKRILDVNVLARGAGDVVLVLVADRHGQKEERRYQLVKLTADALRDQVIKAGKGIASVYWQVGVQGIGPAEIDQLRLRVEPLSRRR